jgi:hypothetical protein
MGFKTVSNEKKQKLIDKVETIAREKALTPHAAASSLGNAAKQKYYSYKRSLGLTTVKEEVTPIDIHPEVKRSYVPRSQKVKRCVMVYGTVSELAAFAREVESA